MLLERRSLIADRIEKRLVVSQIEGRLFHSQLILSVRKFFARLQQFFRAHRVKTDLVKETQRPRGAWGESFRGLPRVPHLDGSPDKLIASWPLHAIHTHIRAP